MGFNSKDIDGNRVPIAVQHTAAGEDVQVVQLGVGVDNAVVPVDSNNPLQVSFTSNPVQATNDSIAAAWMTGQVMSPALGALTIKYAKANIAASTTDGNVVTAVATKKIRVLAFRLLAGGTATNATFNSKGAGAGTAVSELFACGVNTPVPGAPSPLGHFETNAGEALTVTTGAGSTVGVGVVYIEV